MHDSTLNSLVCLKFASIMSNLRIFEEKKYKPKKIFDKII